MAKTFKRRIKVNTKRAKRTKGKSFKTIRVKKKR